MKKQIKILVFALGILISGYSVSFAQQGKHSLDKKLGNILGNNINLEQVESNYLRSPYLQTYGNQAYIAQTGNQNIADINQIRSNSVGAGNTASIVQYFKNNSADINQNGNNNVSQIGQAGKGNSAKTTVSGNDNYTSIYQLGNGNKATQEITGNSKYFYLIQAGNDNTFLQTSNNESVRGYRVYQFGSGLNLKILNGRF